MTDEPEEETIELTLRVPAVPGAVGYQLYVSGTQPYELELPRSLKKRTVQIPGTSSVTVAILIPGEMLHVYETLQYRALMPDDILKEETNGTEEAGPDPAVTPAAEVSAIADGV